MALNTFGAIMAFALDLVTETGECYKTLAQRAKDGELRESLEELARDEARSKARIEEKRRLNVTEMMLEPISGLLKDAYQMEIATSEAAGDREILGLAKALEEREKRYFHDASAKVPLPEVARFFKKIVERKERNLSHLASIGENWGQR